MHQIIKNWILLGELHSHQRKMNKGNLGAYSPMFWSHKRRKTALFRLPADLSVSFADLFAVYALWAEQPINEGVPIKAGRVRVLTKTSAACPLTVAAMYQFRLESETSSCIFWSCSQQLRSSSLWWWWVLFGRFFKNWSTWVEKYAKVTSPVCDAAHNCGR